MNLGERLKELRKILGLNQKEFAEKLNISRTHYSNIENNTVVLTDKLVKLICTTFRINEKWLLTGDGEIKLGELYPDKDFVLEKYNTMREMLNKNISMLDKENLLETVDTFSYFVSLLTCTKYLTQDSEKLLYITYLKKIIDETEKFVFSLGTQKTNKMNYEHLYNQKINEISLIENYKDNIENIKQIFLK